MNNNSTELTFSPRVPITFKSLRGMVKMILKRMGKGTVICDFASDSHKAKAWHISLGVKLTKDEAEEFKKGLQHYAKTRNLCTSKFTDVQLTWGIFNHKQYMGNHDFVRWNVKIG